MQGERMVQLMTPKELSETSGIPVSTLAQWRYLNTGPAYIKLGAHVRYHPEDIEAWQAANRRATS
jgi:predicted DNA-binding transcriptional regulator AlpA